jgi:hopanoid biosynthesis associated RND transporter like protein HpnN
VKPISALVAASTARPWLTTLVAGAMTALAVAFCVGNFAMTTDTAKLISPKVAWRQNEMKLDRAFPQNGDQSVAVVDGKTPELADDAAARLAEALERRTDVIDGVRRPDGGAFFAREGLLFLSPQALQATTDQLVQAQPFLGGLAADPSLRGVASVLQTLAQGVSSKQTTLKSVDAPIQALDGALNDVVQGRPAFFSWQALVSGGKGGLAAPTRRFVTLHPKLNFGALTPGEDTSQAVRQAARDLHLDPAHGVTVRLTGSTPLSDEEFASLADRVWLVTGVMLGAVLLMLGLATRSAKIVAAILVTTLAGLAITAALGLATVGRFNLISVAFVPLFVGLGVDFGIQLSVRFRAERLHAPDIAPALVRSASALGGSLALAAAAVTLGFIAFLPTSYIGVSELGVIAGVGMVVALLLTLTLLPALLVLLKPAPQAREVGWKAMAPVDRFLIEKRKIVLWAFAGSILVSAALIPLIRFDFNPFHLRNPKGEAMATLADLFKDPERTPNTIDVLAPNAAAAKAMAARLSALPQVSQAVTLDSFVPDDQPQKLQAVADAKNLLDFTLNPIAPLPPPSDTDTVSALKIAAGALRDAAGPARAEAPDILEAEHARSLAATLDALADGPADLRARAEATLIPPLNALLAQLRLLLEPQPVTLGTLPADLKADWIGKTGEVRVQVFPKGDSNDNAVLARFADAVRKVAPDATGAPISTVEAGRTITGAFIQAGVLSLIAVTLLLLAVLRSLKEVAFTLAPIVLSIFLTLGTCAVIGLPINFANIIAFPLLVGVGTAFHIYFVMAWRGGTRDLLQSSLARAVLFSALTTGAAFGSLWLSSHPGTASMGKLLLISLVWTLVCALIFEPALLGPTPEEPENPSPAA